MSQAAQARMDYLKNQQSLSMGDFNVDKNWKYAVGGNGQALVFNPNDTKQKFTVGANSGQFNDIADYLNLNNGYIQDPNKISDYGFDPHAQNDASAFSPNNSLENMANQKRLSELVQKISTGQISKAEANAQASTPQASLVGPGQQVYDQAKANPQIANQFGALSNTNNSTNSSTNTTASAGDLASQYAALQGKSPEEIAAQKAIDDQATASRQGQFNVSQQPIAQSFISGQQAAMQTQSDLSKIPLQQQLANAQQKRQASLDSMKFQLDRADKETARQDTLAQNKIENKYKTDTLKNNSSEVKTQIITDDNGNARLINTKTGDVVKDLGGGSLDTTNKAAVKAFQSANGLTADGIVGPKTLAKMNEKGISAKGKESTGSGALPTVSERNAAALQSYSSAFVPGAKLPDGTPVMDNNGFATPKAWKGAIADFSGDRSDFIKKYGYLLYQGSKSDYAGYGLTPQEIKLING